jgi:hypothetical protein
VPQRLDKSPEIEKVHPQLVELKTETPYSNSASNFLDHPAKLQWSNVLVIVTEMS